MYDWYVRGRDLLSSGDAAAAVQILSRTVEAEPQARSAREMLARAQYDARQYAKPRESFADFVERDPADHYAHFGLGLAARKLGDLARRWSIWHWLRPCVPISRATPQELRGRARGSRAGPAR